MPADTGFVDLGAIDAPVNSPDTGQWLDGFLAPAADAPAADFPSPVDTSIPDGPGSCGTNLDCTQPNKSFCVAGTCVGCQGAGANACQAPTPACDLSSGMCVGCTTDGQCAADSARAFCVMGTCVGCNTTGAAGCSARTDGQTVCATAGSSAGRCVECAADSQCTKDPAKGFCVANLCAGCATAGATACSTRDDGKTVCASKGASLGQCVECGLDTDCKRNPAKGFCVVNACTGCDTTGATGCTGRSDGKSICATSGSASGQCVECTSDSQCSRDPAKAFCVANACTGCDTTGATGCGARTDGNTVCSTNGTAHGKCVQCTSNAHCSNTTPICATTTNTCRACASDGDCSGVGPGVCQPDGHCAGDAETIYIGTIGGATCSDTATNAGSAQAPYCTAQSGVGIAKAKGKPLIVITGPLAPSSPVITGTVTLVGKNGAILTPALASDGITITSGEVRLRGLTIQGSSGAMTGVGINATPGTGATVTLRMDGCTVRDNPGGGILLNGAAFEITNTTVTGNGPGSLGAANWGGMLVAALPASGPTSLGAMTIQNNIGGGLSCASGIQGTGVLAVGNTSTTTQITPSCAVTACTTAGATCGARP